MPRSHRRRQQHQGEDSFERLLAGWKKVELKRGAEWTVQPVNARQAHKTYTCPGCAVSITPGTAHLVAWRSDGVLGDRAAVADRRHWHEHCWRIA